MTVFKRCLLPVLLSLTGEWAQAADVTVTVTNGEGKPAADAVVAFYDGKTAEVNPNATGKIVQKNKLFNPKVTVVQTGTSINFPNEDSVRHHVYSFSPAKKFELKLYSGVPTKPLLFDQAWLPGQTKPGVEQKIKLEGVAEVKISIP